MKNDWNFFFPFLNTGTAGWKLAAESLLGHRGGEKRGVKALDTGSVIPSWQQSFLREGVHDAFEMCRQGGRYRTIL